MNLVEKWLQNCRVCPRFCKSNRIKSELGDCRVGDQIIVSSYNLHFGEEPMLVGRGGSGTIFLASCNLNCVFCQNYDISQAVQGKRMSQKELIHVMFQLQEQGAENINFVSPTHQAPQIFEAVKSAKNKGLFIPIVYNCGGYENPGFLKDLEGLVDIYMPDIKYSSNETAKKYSGISRYVNYSRSALKEMHRQVGDLVVNNRGIATKGLLVRHLVMPNGVAGSEDVIAYIADNISPDTWINIMDQYRPMFKAHQYPEINRRVNRDEVYRAVNFAIKKGLLVIE
jgi:putative pyruvate formate lyase activating enzyme